MASVMALPATAVSAVASSQSQVEPEEKRHEDECVAQECEELLKRARKYRQRGELDEELEFAEEALQLCQASPGNGHAEVRATCGLAEAYINQGWRTRSMETVRDALALSEKSDSRIDKAQAMAVLCHVHLLRLAKGGCVPAQESLQVIRDLGLSWGEVITLIAVAATLASLDHEDVRRLSGAHLQAAKEQDNKWAQALPSMVLAVYDFMGHDLDDGLGAREEAWREVQEALALSAGLGLVWTGSREAALQTLTELWVAGAGSTTWAESLLQAAPEGIAWMQPSDETERSQVAALLEACAEAEAAMKAQTPAAALQAARAAASLAEECHHQRGRALALRQAATASLAMDDLQQSRMSAKEALAVYHSCGDRWGSARCWFLLMQVHAREPSVEDATRCGEEAGQLFCELEDKRSLAELLEVRSAMQPLQQQSFREETLDSLKSAAKLYKEVGDNAGEARVWCSIATAFSRTERHADAEEALKQAAIAAADGKSESVAATVSACQAVVCQAKEERRRAALDLQASVQTALRESRPLLAAQAARQAAAAFRSIKDRDGELQVARDTVMEIARHRMADTELSYELVGLAREAQDKEMELQALLMACQSLLQAKESAKAEVAGNEALSLSKNLGHKRSQVSILCFLARALLQQGSLRKAHQQASRAVAAACQEVADPTAEVEASQVLSSVLLAEGDVAGCLEVLNKAAHQAREIGNEALQATIAIAMINAHMGGSFAGNAQAAELAADALPLLRKVGDNLAVALALRAMSAHLLAKREAHEAKDLLAEAMCLSQQARDLQGLAAGMTLLADAAVQLEFGKDAVEIACQALKMHRDSGDVVGELAVLPSLTTAYLQCGDAPAALKAAEDAQRHFEKLRLPAGEAVARHSAAKALQMLDRSDEALQSARRACTLFEKCGDAKGLLQAQTLAMDLHRVAGQIDEALEAARVAWRLSRRLHELRAEAALLAAVAQLQLSKDRPDEAERAAKGAASIFRQLGDVDAESKSLSILEQVRASRGVGDSTAELSESVPEQCEANS